MFTRARFVSIITVVVALFTGCFGSREPTPQEDCGGTPVLIKDCEGDDLNGATCESLGFDSGTLRCSASCKFATSDCINEGPPCGDGQVLDGEQCEPPQEGSCSDLELGEGRWTCTDDCQFDTSGCNDGLRCGNDIAEAGNDEECDGRSLGTKPHCEDHGFPVGTVQCGEDCKYDLSGCGMGECPNGEREGAEQCDGTDLGMATCESIGQGFASGLLHCNQDCTFDTSQCSRCGNDTADVPDGEDCDGPDLQQMTCESLDLVSGSLSCTPLCTFDLSGCITAVCPNDTREGTEQCDGTDLDMATCESIGQGFVGGSLGCNGDCTYDTSMCTRCGNGQIDAADGEECDGNLLTAPTTCAELNPSLEGTITCDSLCRKVLNCVPTFNVIDLGNRFNVRAAQCDGPDGLGLVTSYGNPGFVTELSAIDSQGGVITSTVTNDTATGAVTCNGITFRDITNALNFVRVDPLGALGTAVNLVAMSQSFLAASLLTRTGGGVDTALFYLASGGGPVTVMLLDQLGTVLDTYSGGTITSGTPQRMFAREAAGTIEASVAYQYFSFEDPVEAHVVNAEVNTATNVMTLHDYVIGSWPSGTMPARWDVTQTATGHDVYLQQTATTIEVTPLAPPTLTPGAPSTITASGGTIGAFKVAENASGKYMAAIVDIGGTTYLKLYPLGATNPAALDLLGGYSFDEFAGSIDAFVLGDQRALIVGKTSNMTQAFSRQL